MMNIEQIRTVGVLGGGAMGRQIAMAVAMHGYDTRVYELCAPVRDSLKSWAEEYLEQRVAKGKLTLEQKNAVKAHFHVESNLQAAVGGAQLVIEAVTEDRTIKEKLLKEVSEIVAEDALITTNSSVMASSLFADSVLNPARLANMHFFNPALVMKLVEVVTGPHTSEETGDTLMEFCRRIGKQPARLRKEIEGFIVNRISTSMMLTALELVEQEIATPEDIDIAMENGLNHPIGAFRFMDLIGLDVFFVTLRQRKERGEAVPGFDLVKAKVDAGEFGQKTGKGWYTY